MIEATGYAHPAYAESLSEFGTPRRLPRSGGWLLERPIENTTLSDASGCYPLFSCNDWSGLRADIEQLGEELVSIALVADPFGAHTIKDLRTVFRDKFVPFKEHFAADLSKSAESFVSKHHRYYADRALSAVVVERVRDPAEFLDEWVGLYQHLITRHDLHGIQAFSRRAFAAQLQTPGLVMLRATHEGEIVGSHLWYASGAVVHSHLLALNSKGYELMASYALYATALETFRSEARWLNFGAGAGVNNDSNGLAKFKRGWATDTRTAYFCGRVINSSAYQELAASRGRETTYFPAYRKGEFT